VEFSLHLKFLTFFCQLLSIITSGIRGTSTAASGQYIAGPLGHLDDRKKYHGTSQGVVSERATNPRLGLVFSIMSLQQNNKRR